MAQTNVSSCVLSIVGSFSSGLDVFKKLRERRKRRCRGGRDARKKCDAKTEEEELRLSRSLRQGPEDIGREYARSVYAVGDGFAVGDAPAQTSLAEILLKLNTGLVGIISSFLNGDRRDDSPPDYQALTQLSDRSRIDTCRALRQLFKRLTQPRPLPALAETAPREQGAVKADSRSKQRRRPSSGHARVKGPMLARVVIENSSKPSQIAMVKPSERRKKSSSTSSSELSGASSTPSTPPPEYAPEPPPRPVAVRANTASAAPKTGNKKHTASKSASQSNLAKANRPAARSRSHLQTAVDISPAAFPAATLDKLPPCQPQHASTNLAAQSTPALVHRARKPTPTYYSIASDSTRLGEIPLHKWNVPYDFDQMSFLNKEAEGKGWPVNDVGAGEDVAGKRSGWGLRRLFGKK